MWRGVELLRPTVREAVSLRDGKVPCDEICRRILEYYDHKSPVNTNPTQPHCKAEVFHAVKLAKVTTTILAPTKQRSRLILTSPHDPVPKRKVQRSLGRATGIHP